MAASCAVCVTVSERTGCIITSEIGRSSEICGNVMRAMMLERVKMPTGSPAGDVTSIEPMRFFDITSSTSRKGVLGAHLMGSN